MPEIIQIPDPGKPDADSALSRSAVVLRPYVERGLVTLHAWDFDWSPAFIRIQVCQFKNNFFTEMCSGSKKGSYLRRVDFCITQLQA